jgi:hypothetical protein
VDWLRGAGLCIVVFVVCLLMLADSFIRFGRKQPAEGDKLVSNTGYRHLKALNGVGYCQNIRVESVASTLTCVLGLRVVILDLNLPPLPPLLLLHKLRLQPRISFMHFTPPPDPLVNPTRLSFFPSLVPLTSLNCIVIRLPINIYFLPPL